MLLLLLTVFPFVRGPWTRGPRPAAIRHRDTRHGGATRCPVIAGGDSARRGPSGRRIGKHDRAPQVAGVALGVRRSALAAPSHRTSHPRCSASPYGSSGPCRCGAGLLPRVPCVRSVGRMMLGNLPPFGVGPFHARRDFPGRVFNAITPGRLMFLEPSGSCDPPPSPARHRAGHWAASRPHSPHGERAFGHALHRCGHRPT